MARRSQRLITALLITTLGTQHAGCSTVEVQRQPAAANGTIVNVTPGDDGWVRLCALPIWSNGETPKECLNFKADTPRTILLFAYERRHGLVPVTSKEEAAPPPPSSSSRPSFSLPLGGPDPVGAGVLLLAVLAVVGVGMLVKSAIDSAKPRYPSSDCCFVWIEDSETGETLAGVLPWSPQPGLASHHLVELNGEVRVPRE